MAVKVNVRDLSSQGLISRILDRDYNAQLIATGSYEGETQFITTRVRFTVRYAALRWRRIGEETETESLREAM